MLREASWSRSNSSWGMSQFKRPNDILAASSGFDQRSMTISVSSRILEIAEGLPTIHSVAESGGLSDERCFPPIGRSASQCCRPVNDDNLTASFATDICDFAQSLSEPANRPVNDLRSSPEG